MANSIDFTTVAVRKAAADRLRELRRKVAVDKNRDVTMADVVDVLIEEYSNHNDEMRNAVNA